MEKTPLENFNDAAKLKVTDQVPAVIWAVAPWFLPRNNVSAYDYYKDMEVQFRVQNKLQEAYPDTLLLPGFYPDFGLAAEASGFGCPLVWSEHNAPVPKRKFNDISEVLSMKPINVKTDGLFPEIIKRYEYFSANLNEEYVRKFGYLCGTAQPLGPVELAATMCGYSDFMLELYDRPDLVHKILDITTETLLEWLHYVEQTVGKLKRLIVQDHFACQVSKDMCEEFVFPYLKRIFDEFPHAIKLWHNEGRVNHVFSDIPNLGINVFHFGTDIEETKNAIGDKVCLMGNLNTVELMQDSTPEQVLAEAQRILKIGAKGGGFILTTAGAVGVDTPDENLRAMLDAAKNFQQG